MQYWGELWGLTKGWDLTFWVFFNIAFPVFGSFLIVTWASDSGAILANILKLIGKGELYWTVMAVSGSSAYELMGYREYLDKDSPYGNWAIVAIVLQVIMIAYAAFTVGLVAANKSPASSSTGPNMPLLIRSIVHLVIVLILYGLVHIVASAQQEKWNVAEKTRAANEIRKKTIIDYTCGKQRRNNCLKEGAQNE